MPVAWHPSLASGFSDVDSHHQELLRRLADLVEALEAGRRHEIRPMFAFLGDCVAEHFAAEERAMERTAYPGRTVHVAAHARFARQYAELQAMYEQVGPCACIAVKAATWIQDWLRSHIQGPDCTLARHLRDVGEDVV
jgi:hemerythrin-like metal-binding protein